MQGTRATLNSGQTSRLDRGGGGIVALSVFAMNMVTTVFESYLCFYQTEYSHIHYK